MRRPVVVKQNLYPSLFISKVFLRRVKPCRSPSIRTLDERFIARCKLGVLVSVGAATCSATLASTLGERSWARPSAQSPKLGFGLLRYFAQLCCCQHRSLRIAQGFIAFSTDPQPMQQHCQFASRRNDGPFLSILATTLGQLQTPSSEIAISSKQIGRASFRVSSEYALV